jgi:hypothetical protein
MARASGVLMVVLVAGCGSADPPAAIEAHPAQFAHALCATLFRCCALPGNREQLARWTGNPPDQAFCEDTVAQSLTGRTSYLQDSLSSGRVGYSEVATRACVTALERIPCQDFAWSSAFPVTGCWSLTGRVAIGGGCVENFECANGRCNLSSGRIGACVGLPAAGDPCGSVCRTGLVCEGVCVPGGDKLSGAACTRGIECRSRSCLLDAITNASTCAPVLACGLSP